MAIDENDLHQLRRAIELAHSAIGRSDPNPRVGCVVTDAQGRLIGEGATQRAGDAHAEVMALRAARDAGASTVGGTAWVSLEPCSHHGRTPPCCDALVAAQLARVVIAAIDPNPLVGGAGVQRLRAAGVQVDVADGALAGAAGPGYGSKSPPRLTGARRWTTAAASGSPAKLRAQTATRGAAAPGRC
jgi:diaminohydroxyphosphoribosylaminopyrimidine deaminase/5-amino-6-(5-phosphoribosylamino)uracil reductase